MKKKILIIDDEVQLLEMVKIRLEANNYAVVTASNGPDGLKKAEEEKPDLILLDILMAGMDGYQTLEKLKGSDQAKAIPVLMLTAKSQIGDVTRADSLGAVDYVVKPFNPPMLMEKIRKALEG